MSKVCFEESTVELQSRESLLDGLLRSGHDIPFGCRAGVCHSCLVSLEDGQVPADAQKGLTAGQVSLGHVLSCQCFPNEPIKVRRLDTAGESVHGRVVSKTWLNEQVIQLKLDAALDYVPGQYVTLWKDDHLARSYSLASEPNQDEFLEFHIKVIEEGSFSQWVANTLEIGAELAIQGPLGKCIYTAQPEQPLLLSAVGTGLAPILGILKDALMKGHVGPIHVVIASKEMSGFYLMDELTQLSVEHGNLSVSFVSMGVGELEPSSIHLFHDDIYQFVQKKFSDLKGFRVFLCGAESFVKKMRKQCFLAGAGMGDISADVFLPFTTS